MTTLLIARALLLILLARYCIVKITHFRDTLTVVERVGLGLMAGGAILTIGVVVDPHGPYEGWAPIIPALGMVLYMRKRTERDLAHEQANEAQRDIARRHLIARGKL